MSDCFIYGFLTLSSARFSQFQILKWFKRQSPPRSFFTLLRFFSFRGFGRTDWTGDIYVEPILHESLNVTDKPWQFCKHSNAERAVSHLFEDFLIIFSSFTTGVENECWLQEWHTFGPLLLVAQRSLIRLRKNWVTYEWVHVFESHAPPVFYFPTWKYLTILFKFLDFLRSLDRFKVLIRVFTRSKKTLIYGVLKRWFKWI